MTKPVRRRRPHVKRIPPRTASPVLKDIFNDMTERTISIVDLATVIKRQPNILSEYRRGNVEPGIFTVEEMAHALGYRLKLEPINENDKTKP